MRYHLENNNDAGKIWIQRDFNVEQHKDYIVTIDYKLTPRDFNIYYPQEPTFTDFIKHNSYLSLYSQSIR